MHEISSDIVSAVKEIKSAIVKAQSRVAANANAEMLTLYFGIGQYVSIKTKAEKWGTGVIDAISRQLQQEMPGLRGFSGKNIRSMRQFYENWAKELIWPPVAAKLEAESKEVEALPSAPASNNLSAIPSVVWPSSTTQLKTAGGIILCKSADKAFVEYTVRDFGKPMGVATYRTADEMPENLKRALPPIDELRRQLAIASDTVTESEEA